MGGPNPDKIRRYVEQNIGAFHLKRIEKLKSLKLAAILKRKNLYLFRAKNLLTAESVVKSLLDAHLSSQEETIFGDFLEELAIHVCSLAFGGTKSSSEGVDLDFSRDSVRYIVSIKSGPNWGNSQQIKRMRDNFRQARKILGTKHHVTIVAVNGCCYGRDDKDYGDYRKCCGQTFWELISGKAGFYLEIVEPLGHQAKARNDEFEEKYAEVINEFTLTFMKDFCLSNRIDWHRLLKLNSGTKEDSRPAKPSSRKRS